MKRRDHGIAGGFGHLRQQDSCPPAGPRSWNQPKKQANATVRYGGSVLGADFSPEVGPICTPVFSQVQ